MVGTRGQHAGPGNIAQHRGASPGVRQMSGCLWLLAQEQWSQCWGDGTPSVGGQNPTTHTALDTQVSMTPTTQRTQVKSQPPRRARRAETVTQGEATGTP